MVPNMAEMIIGERILFKGDDHWGEDIVQVR
jgi:hypothetical protein